MAVGLARPEAIRVSAKPAGSVAAPTLEAAKRPPRTIGTNGFAGCDGKRLRLRQEHESRGSIEDPRFWRFGRYRGSPLRAVEVLLYSRVKEKRGASGDYLAGTPIGELSRSEGRVVSGAT
jgi:hypothetical protein